MCDTIILHILGQYPRSPTKTEDFHKHQTEEYPVEIPQKFPQSADTKPWIMPTLEILTQTILEYKSIFSAS